MKIGRKALLCVGIFFGLIGLYLLMLTVMYSFGNGAVLDNANTTITILQSEGDYPDNYIYKIPSRLDNYTDKLMISKTLKDYEGDSFKQAMDNSGYPRYWHGYLVWLKPLLHFWAFPEIRILLGYAQILALCIGFYFITKVFGFKVSIPYIISWLAVYGIVSTLSLQYFSTFVLTSVACAVLAAIYHFGPPVGKYFYVMFFMIVGSLINFLDLLTFPVVTLCVPLVLVLMWEISRQSRLWDNIKTIIICCLAWGISYGMTWLSKWIIATLALGKNVVKDAVEQILFRTGGSQEYPIDRLQVIKSNLSCIELLEFLLTSPGIWIVVILVAVLIGKKKNIVVGLPFLLIALIPYVWYEVLCNHSAIHVFFTYKSQMGTLFAILVYLLFCILPEREQVMKCRQTCMDFYKKITQNKRD